MLLKKSQITFASVVCKWSLRLGIDIVFFFRRFSEDALNVRGTNCFLILLVAVT